MAPAGPRIALIFSISPFFPIFFLSLSFFATLLSGNRMAITGTRDGGDDEERVARIDAQNPPPPPCILFYTVFSNVEILVEKKSLQ